MQATTLSLLRINVLISTTVYCVTCGIVFADFEWDFSAQGVPVRDNDVFKIIARPTIQLNTPSRRRKEGERGVEGGGGEEKKEERKERE